MMPPNNKGQIQPPTLKYQNTGRELNTGFQCTMDPSPTLNEQAMQPKNSQHLHRPRNSVSSDKRARRTSLAVLSAGELPLPGSSASKTLPAPQIMAVQLPPSITTMPAPLPAFPSAMKVPAVSKENQKLRNGVSQRDVYYSILWLTVYRRFGTKKEQNEYRKSRSFARTKN